MVYLKAIDYSDRRKIALLLCCLGAEGQRVYDALGHAETYQEAVALLTNHFMGQQLVLVPQYKLPKWVSVQTMQLICETWHAMQLMGLFKIRSFMICFL